MPNPFLRFWLGSALSGFGTAVTAVALPVLVVQWLAATPFEVGLVNAAQFLPYALLGLLAGVYVDRWRRRTVLVVAGLGRALTLVLILLCWWLGVLQVWLLARHLPSPDAGSAGHCHPRLVRR